MKSFFASCFGVVSRRSLFLVAANALYFGSVLVAALLSQRPYPPLYEWPLSEGVLLQELGGPLLTFLGVFLFNLVASAFLLVTLTGLVFFALPLIVLVVRAAMWGFFLSQFPTPLFLVALLTVVLEGEGYVLASVAGVVLGLSWLKPDWAFRGEGLSRRWALTAAFKECARLYALVAVFLLAGAIVETVTIVLVLTSV